MRLISQLIKELLEHFNDTIISTFFLPLGATVLPIIFGLNLKKVLLLLSVAKSAVSPSGPKNGFISKAFLMFLNNSCYIQSNYTLA